MKNILFAFLFFLPAVVSAQSWQWVKTSISPPGGVDGWACKTDLNNNVYTTAIWFGDSLKIGDSLFRGSGSQAVIAKYDCEGNFRWASSSSHGQCTPVNVTTDVEGNVYLFGVFGTDSLMFGNHLVLNNHIDSQLFFEPSLYGCYFLIKYDSSGNIIWSKTGDNILTSLGAGITTDSHSNIYVVGSFLNSLIKIGSYTLINSSHDSTDIFIAKYDSNGNVLWVKSYGGYSNDWGTAIAVSQDGFIYASGSFASPTISFDSHSLNHTGTNIFHWMWQYLDTWLIKLDVSGNVVWARGSTGNALVENMTVDKGDGIYIGGAVHDSSFLSFGNDTLKNAMISNGAFVAKYDNNGNSIWTNGIYPISVSSYHFGGNFISGMAVNAKTNNIWVSCALCAEDTLTGILLDSITVVHFGDAIDPCVLAEFNSSGTLQQYFTYPSGGDDNTWISADNLGNIYFSSDTWSSLQFGTYSVVPFAGETMILAKYGNSDCAVNSIIDVRRATCTILPNPADQLITVSSPDFKIEKISICNLIGQTIFVQSYNTNYAQIIVANLPAGMYLMRINETEVVKFVKQ